MKEVWMFVAHDDELGVHVTGVFRADSEIEARAAIEAQLERMFMRVTPIGYGPTPGGDPFMDLFEQMPAPTEGAPYVIGGEA